MQNITQILNYDFKDKQLLKNALTHSSVNGGNLFGRLEYLGDAVLELCVSSHLYDIYKNQGEGFLTKQRASIVSEPSLAQAAKDLKLNDFIFLGKGEEISGGREKASILSDVLEAVIGAVYLDGGIEAARGFVLYALHDMIAAAAKADSKDPKTELQEILQRFSPEPIEYRTRPGEDGGFVSEAVYLGEILGSGNGTRKKTAEQNAAKQAIDMVKKRFHS